MAKASKKAAAKKPEKKAGRPEWEPTDQDRKTALAMAGFGVPHADIAKVLGKSKTTLLKHLGEEMGRSKAIKNAKVAQTLYKRATNEEGGRDSVVAAIFWLKAQAGWKERDVTEHELGETFAALVKKATE